MTASHHIEIAHLAVAAARATMPLAPPLFAQPQIDRTSYELLHSGYEHLGLFLDLYGVRDADGYEVVTVSLVGQTDDLCELFNKTVLEQMSRWCEDNLPSAHQLGLVSQLDAAASRAAWERYFVASV